MNRNEEEENESLLNSTLPTLRTFDAFPKASQEFLSQSSRGGITTMILTLLLCWLVWSETRQWWAGREVYQFLIIPGVGHEMQLNIDVTVAMPCTGVQINVQDATGDRLLVGDSLNKEPVNFARVSQNAAHQGQVSYHVAQALSHAGGSRRFHKSDRSLFRKLMNTNNRNLPLDSCRLYGNIEIHRVQGDLHITASGHGYPDLAQVDFNQMNFSHIIEELSFGDFYPNLINPLDGSISTTDRNLNRFQYFLSIVPTVYRTDYRSIHTNQFSVTGQSQPSITQGSASVPGIFFKYDVEPFMLDIHSSSIGFVKFATRLIGLFGGLIVTIDLITRFGEYVVLHFTPQALAAPYDDKGLLHGNT